MQAPRAMTTVRTFGRTIAGFALLSTLLACGYKGPLYMPPPPLPEESLTAPPTPTGLPEPESTNNDKGIGTATPSPIRAQ